MKVSWNRAAALAAAALFLLGAWLLYRGDFWSLGTEARKVEAITSYASANPADPSGMRAVLHPVLLHDETLGDRRVLTFTDQKIDGLLGYVQFRRGLLGGWQPLSAAYGAGPVLETLRVRDRDLFIVFAAHCPPQIARYKVQANLELEETLLAEGDVTAPSFFHVYETDRDYFPRIHLYDAAGRELDQRAYLAAGQSVPSPSIGSAETDLVYWFCAIFLGVGWLVVKYLWDLPKSKQETA